MMAATVGILLSVALGPAAGVAGPERIQRSVIMRIPERGVLLRVFIGESDKWHGKPLYEAIVLKARELHLAGATVLRGPMGFGAKSRLHTAKILRLSEDLPMVIELVDRQEKIDLLLPHIEEMVQEGLVTIEDVRVIRYGARGHGES